MSGDMEADLVVGPSAIKGYSRLSYTMWYALAEFIDNSTQSRSNYEGLIDDVLKQEGTPLTVDIVHNRTSKEISIRDNSIGMSKADLVAALKIAHPTPDSKGRSKYGMGMKTAACWIGNTWKVITCEWGSGEEWTATVDVDAIARETARVPLTMRAVPTDYHYTEVVISDLNRNIQKKSEDTIRAYLGSMYRFDLQSGKLLLTYNGNKVTPPEDYDMDTDPSGKVMRQDFTHTIDGKTIKGWFGVLKKGGRKFGGFSLFQHTRQIQGFPAAWKPSSIFGGVDVEGANNLVAQRLTGLIELDGFDVSHTKDAVLFRGDEEEQLEDFLVAQTKDYREYALSRRSARGQGWSREKFQELMASLKKEFTSGEFKDGLGNAALPPIDMILANNAKQVASLTPADELASFDLDDLKLIISEQERSENDPYVTIAAGADPKTIHFIVNGLHPYYASIESSDAVEECFRQFLYDAVSEYYVSKKTGKINPDAVRRLKNDLLLTRIDAIENAAAAAREQAAGNGN